MKAKKIIWKEQRIKGVLVLVCGYIDNLYFEQFIITRTPKYWESKYMLFINTRYAEAVSLFAYCDTLKDAKETAQDYLDELVENFSE